MNIFSQEERNAAQVVGNVREGVWYMCRDGACEFVSEIVSEGAVIFARSFRCTWNLKGNSFSDASFSQLDLIAEILPPIPVDSPDAQKLALWPEITALLFRCFDHSYNPFEPDNQTKLCEDLKEMLAKVESL